MILIRKRPPLYLIGISEPFPSLDEDFDDLIAIGGDLSVDRMLGAYKMGLFPWFIEYRMPHWYSPRIRMILEPSKFRLSKSLARTIRSDRFEIRTDCAFEQTIVSCANIKRKREKDTWITSDFVKGYCELHELGYARSVESWQNGELVGGLYGLQIGRVFFGESMFASKPDASKAALAFLSRNQPFGEIDMIDCQVPSAHLASLGGVEISRENYLKRLKYAIDNTQ
ncbi:MAG: leucyl/phenylalanyl-tRNA--protein transferase [Helicobacteraceae bacterium]|nr:leucyl/phenylalanyl-tRNA--protein transferase [Helicobacteraceae bacterium]